MTWPREVRASRALRVVAVGSLVASVLAWLIAVAAMLASTLPVGGVITMVAIASGLPLTVGIAAASALRRRIVLHEDAIEIVQLRTGRARLARADIQGRRHLVGAVVLELGPGRKPVEVGARVERDPVLDAWLESIPDLDLEERARTESELLRTLGPTHGEPMFRRPSLARARRVARGAQFATLVLMLASLMIERPHAIVIGGALALPLVVFAIVAAGRGLYTFVDARNEPRASLSAPFFAPGFVVMVCGMREVPVTDPVPLLPWAGAIAGVMILAALRADAPLRRKAPLAIILGVFLFGYGWGASLEVNAALAPAGHRSFETEVIARDVGFPHRHGLEIAPWGPVQLRDTVDVDPLLDRSVEVGDRVCMDLHEGALGAPWFGARACR